MKKKLVAAVLLFVSASVFAGAWGPGSFDNDDAMDWVAECEKSKDESLVSAAIERISKQDLVEASEGAAAIAAMEVVAASVGKPNKALPDGLRAWLKLRSSAKLAKLLPVARKALLKIKDPNASELKQLWAEDGAEAWNAQIADLEARLRR